MKTLHIASIRSGLLGIMLVCATTVLAQMPPPGDFQGFPPGSAPPGFGPRGFGPGGPGGMSEILLVREFDQDHNGWLNASERKAAREHLKTQNTRAPGPFRGPGGPGGRRGGFGPGGFLGGSETESPRPGRKIAPGDVAPAGDAPLYSPKVMRTFFLEFENADWEQELEDFKNTDVEVPAKLTVDGVTFPDVGVHFKGMSSFMSVGAGHKRSLVVTLDFIHEKQEFRGYRKLTLLNSHGDPSFLRTVLSLAIARDYIPAPQANFARVVINGESWGVYVSQQHFNKDLLRDAFGTTKGARWKVPGSPGGRGGLAYLGEDVNQYKGIYEIKSKDDPKDWAKLIQLCKVLDQTPPQDLEKALAPLLDIDGALKFFAWENVLANGDGFWTRASDYSLYLDANKRFHLLPYDANETFSLGGGPGGFGGPGGPMPIGPGAAALSEHALPDGINAAPPRPAFATDGPGQGPRRGAPRGPGGPGFGGIGRGGVTLEPLVAAEDETKTLLFKLLAIPELRQRYLGYIRQIAEQSLDWNKLRPLAKQYQSLIASEIKADTRKLSSFQEFESSIESESDTSEPRGRTGSLQEFAEKRRAFLLNHPEIKKATVPE